MIFFELIIFFSDRFYFHGDRHIGFFEGFVIFKGHLHHNTIGFLFENQGFVFFLFPVFYNFIFSFFRGCCFFRFLFLFRFRRCFRLFCHFWIFRNRSFTLAGLFRHCFILLCFFRLYFFRRVARFGMNMFRSFTDQHRFRFAKALLAMDMTFMFFLPADEISFFVIAGFIVCMAFTFFKTAY